MKGEMKLMEKCFNIFTGFFAKALSRGDFLFEKWADSVFQKKNISLGIVIFLLLLMVVVIYLLNLHTTLIVDDYGYSFNSRGERYTSLSEVFTRLWLHYFQWGGRVVVHFFAIVFLWIGKPIFNICNTIAFLITVCMMYYLAVGSWPWARKQNFPMILLAIFFFLFAFTPAFGQDFLWLVGSCNYLWGILLFLWMLIPFRKQMFSTENVYHNPIWWPLFFVGNVLAGWCNENMGVTLVGMIAACIFLYWIEYHKVRPWMIFALAGAVIGATCLVLAPGNFVRFHTEGGGHTLNILDNFMTISRILVGPQFLLIPFCLTVALKILTKSVNDKRKNIILYFFLFGMLASAYSMIVSPYFTERARLGTLVLGIIACVSLYPYLEIRTIEWKKVICIVAVMMTAILGSDIKAGYKDIVSYEKRNNEKVAYTLIEKEKGHKDIIVIRNYPSTKYCAAWGLEDINVDPKHWTNTGYAHYFGVRSVRVSKPETYSE